MSRLAAYPAVNLSIQWSINGYPEETRDNIKCGNPDVTLSLCPARNGTMPTTGPKLINVTEMRTEAM